MPDPSIAIALVLLVALVEATPLVRVPIGLLLAIGLLASDAELLPIALLGAIGVMLARLALAQTARTLRQSRTQAPHAEARREAMRAQLAGSAAYPRMTFLLGALPGVPASFLFPLLGTMRTPLWPALAGTIAGRTPVLALTAALFTWLGRAVSDGDDEAVVTLGLFAVILLVVRAIGQVDWQHRSATGSWRLRDVDDRMVRMTTNLGGRPGGHAAGTPDPYSDDDVVEGEVLGVEFDDDDDDMPPGSLPPTGLAPS